MGGEGAAIDEAPVSTFFCRGKTLENGLQLIGILGGTAERTN